jgi:hypothetical protein
VSEENKPSAWDADVYSVPTYPSPTKLNADLAVTEEGVPIITFEQLAAFGINEGDEFTISTDLVTFSLYVGFGDNIVPKPVAWAKWNGVGPLEWFAVDSPP